MTHGNRLNGISLTCDVVEGTVVDGYTASTLEHRIFVDSVSTLWGWYSGKLVLTGHRARIDGAGLR
jgi:hypothetical protein